MFPFRRAEERRPAALVEAMDLVDEDDGSRAVLLGPLGICMTCLISLIPASTAENSMNSRFGHARDDFCERGLPVPGGPRNISDPGRPRSICVRSGLPGPTRCSCPT